MADLAITVAAVVVVMAALVVLADTSLNPVAMLLLITGALVAGNWLTVLLPIKFI